MSSYNSDELETPAWIDEDFLKKVLATHHNDKDVKICKYDMKPASMKGDHYASIMFRCKVEYYICADVSVKHMSFIIKTLPLEEGMKREMLMETKLFETEIAMYTEVLPRIEKILLESGEPTKMSAGIIYHCLEPHKVIVLEDLCQSGYDTVRGRFLTENEIKAVYSKLAKLHAVSYVLGKSENHEVVTKYQDGFMNCSVAFLKDLLPNGMRNLLNTLASHDEFSLYFEKIKLMQPEMEKACKDLFNAYTLNNGQGDIFVLNHGDFHMKNLMFKFNQDNQMEDIIMVDYQISCFAPSIIDLIYSQYMMLSPELRRRRNEFMQYYFSEFLQVLRTINYEGAMPKYSQFQMTSLKYRHFVLYCLAVIYPIILDNFSKSAEELKDTDFNELLENPDVSAANCNSPLFIKELREMMPILMQDGFLD